MTRKVKAVRVTRAQKALHYLLVDLKFLLGAIQASDPPNQIEARVRFLIKDAERGITPHAKKKGKANG